MQVVRQEEEHPFTVGVGAEAELFDVRSWSTASNKPVISSSRYAITHLPRLGAATGLAARATVTASGISSVGRAARIMGSDAFP